MPSSRKVVVSARNARLHNDDGSSHIDLFGANGTLLLGHGNETVVRVMGEQNQKLWITGRLDSDIRLQATALVDAVLETGHSVSGFYSTGMEAAEFGLRAARVLTGRKDLVGFDKCMHGKSLATAFLAWDNPNGYPLPGFTRLPFPSPDRASETLADLETVLSRRSTAAVFLEPIQGSGGGAAVDAASCAELSRLCKAHGTLLIADEILTGFHRTGPLFFHSRFPLEPDIILAGKCMGNGFPVSAVLLRKGLEINSRMLPYSTYAENALAAAAVVGTLTEIARLPVERMAADIEARITGHLAAAAPEGFRRAGFGAMCIVDTGDARIAKRIADTCYDNGVLISQAGPILRLLPPLTIDEPDLEVALSVLDAAIASSA